MLARANDEKRMNLYASSHCIQEKLLSIVFNEYDSHDLGVHTFGGTSKKLSTKNEIKQELTGLRTAKSRICK